MIASPLELTMDELSVVRVIYPATFCTRPEERCGFSCRGVLIKFGKKFAGLSNKFVEGKASRADTVHV
jgi:hypothetical protein